MSTKNKKPAANIVWFEIPADKPERARTFYRKLFGWKINPFPAMPDYQHIETGGPDASPDGGLMKRRHPGQSITNYVFVASVTKSAAMVEKLGGKVCVHRSAVPQMGYFAVCQDTENNSFAIWERNQTAK